MTRILAVDATSGSRREGGSTPGAQGGEYMPSVPPGELYDQWARATQTAVRAPAREPGHGKRNHDEAEDGHEGP